MLRRPIVRIPVIGDLIRRALRRGDKPRPPKEPKKKPKPPKPPKPTGPSGPSGPTGPTAPPAATGPTGPPTPAAVTAQTDFRRTGNTTREAFRAALRRTSSATPNHALVAEADAIYDVLLPHGLTRLAAMMAWIERSNDTWEPGWRQYYGPELHNLWAMKSPRTSDWMRYASYASAAADWAARILGPTYAAERTIAAFIARYAPRSDGNDTDRYIARVVDGVNALPLMGAREPEPEPEPKPTPEPEPPHAPVTAQDVLNLISNAAPGVYVSFGFGEPNLDGGRPVNIYRYGTGHGATGDHIHPGIDIWMPDETPVNAVFGGEVVCVGDRGSVLWGQGCGYFSDDDGGLGNITILSDVPIDYGGKVYPHLKITYGHMSSAAVRVGQRVVGGQRIGRSGVAAGWPHIHLDTVIRAPELNRAAIWNTPGDYHLVNPLPAILRVLNEGGTTPAPTPSRPTGDPYDVPGLGRIHLPFPLEVRLIPPGQTRQRPGTPMRPDRFVQHDTGNTQVGAGADHHRHYLEIGAPDDAGNPQVLSYHVTVDDRKAVWLIPANEVAWANGDGSTGPCNRRGISSELCVNADADHALARDNAALLAAEVMNAAGMESLKPHVACSGKQCPRSILDALGGFQGFVEHVSRYRQERA